MKQTEVLQEIRKMKFEEICSLQTRKHLSMVEAAQLLGMSERTLRRYRRRYEAEGLDGLSDKRLGRAAHNAVPVDEVMTMTDLYQRHYEGYSVAHFFDKYRSEHRGTRSYNWVRNTLHKQGIVACRKKRGAHRQRRPRQPLKGMMLHQDGSTHQWVEGVYWDLIVTLDDADNEIYSAFFVEEEGTWSSLQGVKEVIERQGLFCSLYTDRGSHYWTTPQAGKGVDKAQLTQFGQAMKRLGIEMIAAYSPEARGRSERMFGTLQGRLPLELKSAGITTLEAGNQFLRERFIAEFNQRFKVSPQGEGTAFVPWLSYHLALEDVLCLQEQRIVAKDNTIRYKGRHWQIPPCSERYSYAKAKVRVHEYQDGSIAIFHGPRKLVHHAAPLQEALAEAACGLREFVDNGCAVTHKLPEGPQAQQQAF